MAREIPDTAEGSVYGRPSRASGRQPAMAKDIAITPRVTSTKVAVGLMRPSCLFRKAQMNFLSIFTEVVSYPSEL